MPKCSWIRSRGANKGKACGNYTRWKVDGEFYCTAHKNMIKSSKTDAVIYHDTTINTLQKRINELERRLEEKNKSDPIAEIQEQEIFDMSCTEVIGSDTESMDEELYAPVARKTVTKTKSKKPKKRVGFKNPMKLEQMTPSTFEEIMNLKFD